MLLLTNTEATDSRIATGSSSSSSSSSSSASGGKDKNKDQHTSSTALITRAVPDFMVPLCLLPFTITLFCNQHSSTSALQNCLLNFPIFISHVPLLLRPFPLHNTSHPQKSSTTVAKRSVQHIPQPAWHAPWELCSVVSGHLGWVRSVAFDPSNEWFATGSADRTIKVSS